MKTRHPVLLCFVLVTGLALVILGCGDQPQTKETPEEESLSVTPEEGKDVLQDKDASPPPIDYGQLMESVFALEQSVLAEPQSLETRMDLIRMAWDADRHKLYTVGEGLPREDAPTPSLARQSAERAALVDAQRWALRLLSWKSDPQTGELSEDISGEVPPHRIVQKAHFPGDKVYLMIEVDIPAG